VCVCVCVRVCVCVCVCACVCLSCSVMSACSHRARKFHVYPHQYWLKVTYVSRIYAFRCKPLWLNSLSVPVTCPLPPRVRLQLRQPRRLPTQHRLFRINCVRSCWTPPTCDRVSLPCASVCPSHAPRVHASLHCNFARRRVIFSVCRSSVTCRVLPAALPPLTRSHWGRSWLNSQ
jgi:hypothetical protein